MKEPHSKRMEPVGGRARKGAHTPVGAARETWRVQPPHMLQVIQHAAWKSRRGITVPRLRAVQNSHTVSNLGQATEPL